MINEQELAEAVDRLREGETVMGVAHEDVIEAISNKKGVVIVLLDELFCVDEPQEYFERKFNEAAADLLREAYRTKLELEAGL